MIKFRRTSFSVLFVFPNNLLWIWIFDILILRFKLELMSITSSQEQGRKNSFNLNVSERHWNPEASLLKAYLNFKLLKSSAENWESKNSQLSSDL